MSTNNSQFFTDDLKLLYEMFQAPNVLGREDASQRQQYYQEDIELFLQQVLAEDPLLYQSIAGFIQDKGMPIDFSALVNEGPLDDVLELGNLINITTKYDELIEQYAWTSGSPERLALSLALVNEMLPDFFPALFDQEREYIDWGFVKKANGHYISTGRTVLQLCLRNQLKSYQEVAHMFTTDHPFVQLVIFEVDDAPLMESILLQPLKLSLNYHSLLIDGHPYQPQYSTSFPATLLTTTKNWEDLHLNSREEKLIKSARQWVLHYDKVAAKIGEGQMRGYRLLMYGASGTGKTLTAALLGKEAGKPVYRINISNIVDKYVGETNKKLEKLFAMATQKDWILFFDEADALFGKRTSTSSAQDRYANQEVSYLLYKMEEYQGTIFLATNQGVNLDDAFTRRFDTQVQYREPEEIPRYRLWQYFFNEQLVTLDPAIDLQALAYRITCTGAWIEKFRNYCVLQQQMLGEQVIDKAHFIHFLYDFSLSHKVSIRGEFQNVLD